MTFGYEVTKVVRFRKERDRTIGLDMDHFQHIIICRMYPRKIRKIRTPPCHAYIPHNRGSNDEDDQVPHRTQFPAKGDDRSDDRCEPYRLQQHDNGMQDTFQKDQRIAFSVRYEQDGNEDET